MWLNKFIIVIVSLIVRICESDIVLESSESYGASKVNMAAIDLITSCYGNRGDAVALGGIISGSFVTALSLKRIPIVLVDDSSRIAIKDRYLVLTPRYRLQVFVLAESTSGDLRKSIAELQRSIWWNHMASFLILYRSSQGCKGAQYLLLVAWYRNLINGKVLCFDRQSGIQILGYNPFTPEAPKPWRLYAVYPYAKLKNNRFAVFYRYGREICENLDFEKVINLNGYPIEQLYLERGELAYTGNKKHIRNDAAMYSNVMYTIISALNGTDVLIKYTHESQKLQYFNDLIFGIVSLEGGLEFMVSRPFISTGMVAMTQHSGHKSQLEKIITVVDIYTNISVCIALVVIFLFFTFVARLGTVPAILNTVRIICNTGFVNLPRNLPSRLYLATVLMFVVTMQGIYQGNLASLLTTVVPYPNINTWDDLLNSRHTIYISEDNKQFLQYPQFAGRVVLLYGRGDCSQYVLHNSSVACIHFEAILKDQAEKLRLHLSELLKPSLGVVRFCRNWPLEKRFNYLLGKLYEADVIVPFELRTNQKTLNDFAYDDDVKNNQDFRNITLHDMIFAFVILGIGLTCALITFLFEILINRFRSKGSVAII